MVAKSLHSQLDCISICGSLTAEQSIFCLVEVRTPRARYLSDLFTQVQWLCDEYISSL